MNNSLRITKAKSKLILRHPFVGSIALGMTTKLVRGDSSIPTAATNGSYIVFNEDWIDTLTDDELLFVTAHECMHPMLEHPYRRRNRDPRRWNQAGDYVINELLVQEGIGTMPSIGLRNTDLYNAGQGKTDKIYNILDDQNRNGDNSNDNNPLDDCQDAGVKDQLSPAQIAQDQADWKVRVAQAAQAAKMQGTLSAGMERLVDEILRPKVDWKEVMQRFIRKFVKNERTFARMNRRFITQDLYLPSKTGEILNNVVFAIDCSGSVGQDELTAYKSEVMYVHRDLKPRNLTVLGFSTDVTSCDTFKPDDIIDFKLKGGGGTSFSCIFEYLQKNNVDPDVCIVLTDLGSDDYGPQPDYPVLWIDTYGHYKAPWGEVVVVE